MIVAATRLRVRSAWLLLPFMLGAMWSQRQAVRARGFIGGRLLIDRHRTFWTLTTGIAAQLLFHEVHHRAQVMAMPRQLGIAAENRGTEVPSAWGGHDGKRLE